MLKEIFLRYKKDPLGFIKRTIYKTVIGPLKYNKMDGYDAAGYWRDRFSKYGQSIRGPGDEGLTEEENKKMYAEVSKIFLDLCKSEAIDFRNKSVLEIGCGAGFYTRLLCELGVKNYLGIDITDVFFPRLRKSFPQFIFQRKDITSDRITERFDLIIMIDVIEHIVKENKLSLAMENVKNCLLSNALFIVAPVMKVSQRRLFYLRLWSKGDIKRRFPGYTFRELELAKNSYIFSIRKP